MRSSPSHFGPAHVRMGSAARALFALALGGGLLAAPALAAAQQTITYSYDPVKRVVTVQHSGTGNNTTTSFTYDPADNRKSISVAGTANFQVIVLPLAGFVVIPLQNNGNQ